MMRRIAAATVGSALIAGTAAATPGPRCAPRSAEIVLAPEEKFADSDMVRYRDLSGRPQRGDASVSLCPGVVYRIAAKDDQCVIRIPRAGSVTQIRAAIARQMRARPACPAPAIIVTQRLAPPGYESHPATAIIPGDTIDVRQRREIVVVLGTELPPVKPACHFAAMPGAIGMTVGAALKAYRDRLSTFDCGRFDARVWTGNRLATADDPEVAGLILQRAWPDIDTSFDGASFHPAWFVAASPPAFKLPDLRNKTLAEARRMAADAGLALPAAVADNQFIDDKAAGDRTIVAQRPAAGNGLTGSDRLLLVLNAQSVEPLSTAPAALVASGAIGGIATAALAGRIARRRVSSDPPQPTRIGSLVIDHDRNRIRVRPDIPPLQRREGGSAPNLLASLLPLSTIGNAPLLAALSDTHPDLIDWSRSNRAGALPPDRLARLVLAGLPTAFAVTIEDLLLNWAGPDTGGRVGLVNRPIIDVLNSDGSLRDAISFIVEITLAPSTLPHRGDQSPRTLDFSVSIASSASNASRVVLGDVRRVVSITG